MTFVRKYPIAITMALFILLIGLTGVFVTLNQWTVWNQLQEEGVAVAAEVETLETTAPVGATSTVTYLFTTTEGETILVRDVRIPYRLYQELEPGDTLNIRYLPADPEITIVEASRQQLVAFTATTAAWIIGGLGIIGVYVWIMRRLEAARQRQAELWDQAMARMHEAMSRPEEIE